MPNSYEYMSAIQRSSSTPQNISALPNYSGALKVIGNEYAQQVDSAQNRLRYDAAKFDYDMSKRMLNSARTENALATAISVGGVGVEGYNQYKTKQYEEDKDEMLRQQQLQYDTIIHALINNVDSVASEFGKLRDFGYYYPTVNSTLGNYSPPTGNIILDETGGR